MNLDMTRPGKRARRFPLIGGDERRWIASLSLASAVAVSSLGCSDRSPRSDLATEQAFSIETPWMAEEARPFAGPLDPPELTEIEAADDSTAPIAVDPVSTIEGRGAASSESSVSGNSDAPSTSALAQLTSAQAGNNSGGARDRGSSKAQSGAIEQIDAPPGEPEAAAEVIPTPAGIRDGAMAKVAERGGSEASGDATTPPSTAELSDTAGRGANERVALIDATDVEGTKPEDYRTWPVPDVALVVTGQQHGYIEPCGCTGLENQKGGVARRMTFMQDLRASGWNLLPIDGGNQVRRFGRQAEIKFQRTAEALRKMDYRAVGFGPDDLRLGVGELISVAASEDPEEAMYVSANVVLLDPTLMPQQKVIETGGMKIGVTSVLDPESLTVKPTDELSVEPPVEAARAALEEMSKAGSQFNVLLFFGEEEAATKLVSAVSGFDLVVVAGGYGEPTYRPQSLNDKTQMIVTGNKGMYAGLVGLYRDQPLRYARVPLTHEFEDAPQMRQLMADYQNQLRDLGFEGLGLKPIRHPSGNEFVGSATCGECHSTAFQIWEGTPHAEATQSLVHPGERSDVPRHFDPECLSCHVTGWNPQNYYPYQSGYLDLDQHAHLTGNGCENCHGPGSAHVAVEQGEVDVPEARRDELRASMRLPLASARERCMECHDLDNSPDFHEEGAFDEYWAQIEHYGKD